MAPNHTPGGGRPDDGDYRTYEMTQGEHPSEAVVTAVSAVTGRRPVDFEPLSEAADPDALDTLFAAEGSAGVERCLSFTYAGCRIVVECGRVSVRERRE